MVGAAGVGPCPFSVVLRCECRARLCRAGRIRRRKAEKRQQGRCELRHDGKPLGGIWNPEGNVARKPARRNSWCTPLVLSPSRSLPKVRRTAISSIHAAPQKQSPGLYLMAGGKKLSSVICHLQPVICSFTSPSPSAPRKAPAAASDSGPRS